MGSKENINLTETEPEKKDQEILRNKFYEDCLNEEEDKKNLTAGEKIKDFVSDHSDSFGCLTFLMAVSLLSWGIYASYNYFEDKKEQAQLVANQALEESKKLDGTFIATLRPFVSKMTKENAPRVLNAVKNIMLIDHPNSAKALDLLRKKYETEYYKHENNYEFETFLAIKSSEDMMEKVSRITSSCPSLLIIPQHTR
ncbi:MAG: hypothetical protein IKL33_00440 [Alphaproteobacteria bacterium]|nr:hypothetical protein [Alphaproteobacteria bacterium]